jgi:hypothetical protein
MAVVTLSGGAPMSDLIVVRWPGSDERWWRWDQARHSFHKQWTCCWRHRTAFPMTAAWHRSPYPREVALVLRYYKVVPDAPTRPARGRAALAAAKEEAQ